MIRWLVISVLAAAIAFVLGVMLGRKDGEPAEHLGVLIHRTGRFLEVLADVDLPSYPKPGRDVWVLAP